MSTARISGRYGASGASLTINAVQIARQLCAAVSAAHECGVLHRDLKPANVMIDGRGVRAVQFSLLAILIVVVLRLVCRWPWLALALTSVFRSVSTWQNMTSSTSWLRAIAVISGALLTFVAVRFGLLALVVAWFVWSAVYGTPLTLDLSHWSATASTWMLALVAALAAFGFSAARAGTRGCRREHQPLSSTEAWLDTSRHEA